MALILLTLVAIALPAVWMTLQIIESQGVYCEVCMTFNGHMECRKAQASNNQDCQRTGTDNACALLASGVTDTINCTQSTPTKVEFGTAPQTSPK